VVPAGSTSQRRASGAATDTTSERLSYLQLCGGIPGCRGPSGADEARTGDLHHDEQ
jgi:hypothetical protein